MKGWRKFRLGDGCITNANSYTPKEKWKFVNYLDTGNITDNKINAIQYIDIENEKLPSRARRKVQENSIIYSTVRPKQRHFGIIKNQPDNFLVSTGFVVIDVNESILDADFLYYLLTQNIVVEKLHIIAEQSVSTYPSIKPSDIENLEISIPDIVVQKRIASILGCLDKKIEQNNMINKNLLQQIMTLYNKLVKNSDWPATTIHDIAEKVAMGPFGSNIKVSTFVPKGVPIISGNHLRGYFLEEPEFNYITEEHADRLKNSSVYPHDIIFTHAGNIGQVAMIPDGCKYDRYVLSQRQFYLRCDETKVVPEFILMFFHSTYGQHELLSYANQTGVPSIARPATNLKKILFKCPPIEVQLEWKAQVSPLIGSYINNRDENESLASLRDALLPKLMSGEIDVSNIDI
jgi:type I restriction enzyme S subunit